MIIFINIQERIIIMNDLEKMCKSLVKGKTGCGNYRCPGDNYMCAKYVVKQYIFKGDNRIDKNRLLLLKSECREDHFLGSYSSLVSTISMAICALTLLYSIVASLKDEAIFDYSLLLIFILVFFYILLFVSIKKDKLMVKWKSYILTAIEELEKEV